MNVLENFKKVKAFVFDIDGVLATDAFIVLEGGQLIRSMNSKDGYALQLAVKKGYDVAIISGGDSEPVKIRLERLGIKEVFLKVTNKKEKLSEYVLSKGLKWEEVLYMGDDIPDYDCLKMVGLPCCPANAAVEIKEIAKYISPINGGEGCARDIIEKVLKLNGNWGIDTSVQNK